MNNSNGAQEPFVDIETAVAFLSLKVSLMYELVRTGKLPSYKISKFRRFKISELETWAKGQGQQSK